LLAHFDRYGASVFVVPRYVLAAGPRCRR
jgi:hypothetical protein